MKKLSLLENNKDFFSSERRSFLQKIFGVSVATASAYFITVSDSIAQTTTVTEKKTRRPHIHMKPGEYDNYYGFWSGGPSGEVRILGIPSMRELKRIPVFNFNPSYGHGITSHSKRLLGKFTVGDTHHMHLSYQDGTYDGRFAFVNDKSIGRLARIRLDYMEVDAITEIPNSQGVHGIFPSRNRLDGVYCNTEFRTPYPYNRPRSP